MALGKGVFLFLVIAMVLLVFVKSDFFPTAPSESVPAPPADSNNSVFLLRDGNYVVDKINFTVSSTCEGKRFCGGECCGGLHEGVRISDEILVECNLPHIITCATNPEWICCQIGKSTEEIWLLNGNYSWQTRYDICAHEEMHGRLYLSGELEVEVARLQEKVEGKMVLTCIELLRLAAK